MRIGMRSFMSGRNECPDCETWWHAPGDADSSCWICGRVVSHRVADDPPTVSPDEPPVGAAVCLSNDTHVVWLSAAEARLVAAAVGAEVTSS